MGAGCTPLQHLEYPAVNSLLLSFFAPRILGMVCFGISVLFALVLILYRGKRNPACPACRQPTVAHAKYCGHCGQQLG